MLSIKIFYSYGYWFWIILFAHLNDKHWFIIFFPQVWKVLLDTFHIGILFMFHYTFIHKLKSLNTSSSRFILNYYICPILCTAQSSALNFGLMVTEISIIDTRRPKLWSKKFRNSCKHSPLFWFVEWWTVNVPWVYKLWCLIFLSIF